jgi:prepilin-type N-terminal cleavage/methylation domain-containing protein
MSNVKQEGLKEKARGSSGFTLVELLVVIAVITIMVAISGPAISSIVNSGGVNWTINGISLLLEESRAYALSHNTYVWVGFYPNPAKATVTVVAVGGTSGLQSDLGSTLTWAPISKMQTYNNLILTSPNVLPGLNAANDITTCTLPYLPFQMTLPGSSTPINFSYAVQFSPQGQAAVMVSSPSHWVQVVLQPVRGGNSANLDPNLSVIQVASLTGQVEIFRK